MIKLIRRLCMENCEKQAKKKTVKLLFFNKTVKDILWMDKLQSLSEKDSWQVIFVDTHYIYCYINS